MDRETRMAYRMTGAYDRIARSGSETEEMSAAENIVDFGPTMWVTYAAGEIKYRGFNPMMALAVAQEHQDIETVIDEVPASWFQTDTLTSMPIMGFQPYDDAERGAVCPGTIDVLIGWSDLTMMDGGSVGEDLHPYEWEDSLTMYQQDMIAEERTDVYEVAWGNLGELVGC